MVEAVGVVVHRHGENLLRAFLADHVLIEDVANLLRTRQVGLRQARLRASSRGLVANDLVAQIDAFIADEDRWAGNQFFHFMLALAAKRAIQQLLAVRTFLVRHGYMSLRTLE